MNVFKFGGASVKDANGIKNVASILKVHDEPLIVVVSAMGKMTNEIETVIQLASTEELELANSKWSEICARHQAIAAELKCEEHASIYLNEYRQEGSQLIYSYSKTNKDEFYDQLISRGELMSTTLVTAYLLSKGMSAKWLDARKMIKSDEHFRQANVQWRETEIAVKGIVEDHSERYSLLVTQGFIAGTRDGRTTTLGREGSDYTAAILSYCLDASSMTIWKDVPGVLTADPRLFPEAVLVPKLSYREAIEMTYYGAQVIHPKTIQPIQRKSIPLYVKSFAHPSEDGTLIDSSDELDYPPMIVVTKNQYLLRFSSKDFSFIAEKHLSMLFRKFSHFRIRVNLMRNTAISFTVSVSAERDRLDLLKEELQYEFTISEQENLELITVRHYDNKTISKLKENKQVIFEEIQGVTFQMVTETRNR